MTKTDILRARPVLLTQALLVTALTGIAALFGLPIAVSAFVGGLASLLPNALFAWLLFAPYSATEPERLLGRAYAAEIIKLALSALIFAAAFFWLGSWVNPLALFSAFLIVQVLSPLLAH